MSEIRVDTLSDTAGTGPVAFTKQVALQAFYSALNDTPTVFDSFNFSSFTNSGTGNSFGTFTNTFSTSPASVGSANVDTAARMGPTVTSTSIMRSRCWGDNGVASTTSRNAMATGDLA